MEIKITNPNKILFPKEKLTKLDLIKYYYDISEKMLPFVKNRFLSVIRCHDGVKGECFFKKHPASDKEVETKKYKGENYFYVKNENQLVYQVQMGTVEFHTWGSEITSLKKPSIMVFDLDPDEKFSLDKLRKSVLKVKSVLDDLKLKSFLKTSGGKGYHIVVPFKTCKNWDVFYDFSRQIATVCENKWEKEITTNIRKEKRRGKIFVDYLRNNIGATCVAPYSVRARDGAPVSMPIPWKKLESVKPNEVNIKNYKKYLNDSWSDFFDTNTKLG